MVGQNISKIYKKHKLNLKFVLEHFESEFVIFNYIEKALKKFKHSMDVCNCWFFCGSNLKVKNNEKKNESTEIKTLMTDESHRFV